MNKHGRPSLFGQVWLTLISPGPWAAPVGGAGASQADVPGHVAAAASPANMGLLAC
jgi:hypothetical protein